MPTAWPRATTCSSATAWRWNGSAPRSPGANVGIVLNFTPVTPVGSSPAALDRQTHRQRLREPLVRRPDRRARLSAVHRRSTRLGAGRGPRRRHGADRPADRHARRQLLHAPDGRRARRRAGPIAARRRRWDGRCTRRRSATCCAVCTTTHHFPRYLITENGAAMPDSDVVDGRVIDDDRLEYIAAHLGQVHQAMEDGVPVDGYFAWSLLDNFEWAPRLRAEVRPRRGRHGDPTPHPEAERPLVRRGRQVRRDPTHPT